MFVFQNTHVQETLESEKSLIFRHSVKKDFLALTKEINFKGFTYTYNMVNCIYLLDHGLTVPTVNC